MKTLIEDSNNRVASIKETNEWIKTVTPKSDPVGTIAKKILPSDYWLSSPLNTARSGSEDYIVSGYPDFKDIYENVEVRDQSQDALIDTLFSFGRPTADKWVKLPRQDWTPLLWEFPIIHGFTQQFADALTQYRKETVERALRRLQVDYDIDDQILPLLNRETLEAVTIVSDILADRISGGLPADYVSVRLLVDYDGGQWEEIAFDVHVNLNTEEADQEWDNVLAIIADTADRLTDKEVANALLDKVGIFFTWLTRIYAKPSRIH